MSQEFRPGCPELRKLLSGVRRDERAVRRAGRAATVDAMPHDRQETPVVLSRIYTRTGDDGTTALGDGSRAAKTDPRLTAYADVDEANCAIGLAVTLGGLPDDITSLLDPAAERAFRRGRRPVQPGRRAARPTRRCASTRTTSPALEQACDEYNEGLPVAAQLRAAGRQRGRRAAAHGQDRRSGGRSAAPGRPWQAHGATMSPLPAQVPEPAVRPAVHPGPAGQRARRRPAVEAGRRTLPAPATGQRDAGRRPRGWPAPDARPGQAGGRRGGLSQARKPVSAAWLAASSQARNPVSAPSLARARAAAPSAGRRTPPPPRRPEAGGLGVGRPALRAPRPGRAAGVDLARPQPEAERR